MITDNLFDNVLVNPVVDQNANTLYIVSGYSTPAMVFNHFERLREMRRDITVHLLIGMAPLDGITRRNHDAFKQLMNQDLSEKFYCSYLSNMPAVHSKLYMWYRHDEPIVGFIGSANYTQRAFKGIVQNEALDNISPVEGKGYFDLLASRSVFCIHDDAELLAFATTPITPEQRQTTLPTDVIGLESQVVSLLNYRGEVSRSSGLNWGQRLRREPNQAYIPLKAEVVRSSFFPPRGQHFTVYTDDSRILICSRAQGDDEGKAIHTPHNNSLLGLYFRHRLGLQSGAYVALSHLESYGRTDVTFYKIDEESYYMDFSVPHVAT